MSHNIELPSYTNISAEEMASKIGINSKHIPILVKSFVQESMGLLQQLEAAVLSKNYNEIASIAHSIKGSSGNLKFDEMYLLAREMELSAKGNKEEFPYKDACESIKKAIDSISL